MSEDFNRRILLVDDTASIHDDFKKILGAEDDASQGLLDAKAAFFGGDSPAAEPKGATFELDSALQGQEALECVQKATDESRPYAMAFVDMRMPPGWDGIQTIEALWKIAPELQVVICTAYSDYSWDQTIQRLGQSDRLLILKKPFDSIEICQLAAALTEKWNAAHREGLLIEELKRAEQEARAYASSLETVNQALVTSKAAAEKSSELKSEFLVHLSDRIQSDMQAILSQVDVLKGAGSPDAVGELDAILGSSGKLMTTFDEILDLTLIESGRLELETGSCPVAETLNAAMSEHQDAARSKGLELELQYTGSIPESIQSDPRRVQQVVSQLVGHAVAASPSGTVRVAVSVQTTGDWQNSLLRCEVIDTAKAVPPEDRGQLFEPVFRTKGDSRPGSGLGLALAKQLARRLGGDIAVDASGGDGNAYALTLETGDLSGVKMIEKISS